MNLHRTIQLIKLSALGLLMAGAVQAESLNWVMPDGWVIAIEQDGLVQLVPRGERAHDWNRTIIMQTDTFPRPVDPTEYLNVVAEQFKRHCEDTKLLPLTNGEANGFPFAAALITCSKNLSNTHGEVYAYKAIQGQWQFHTVHYAYRTEPFTGGQPAKDEEFRKYVDQVMKFQVQ